MNLLHQLQAAKATVVKPTIQQRNTEPAWQAKHDKAVADYRRVMQYQGWLTQRQIECKLGYAHTASTPFLTKALELGYVERRNRGGGAKFIKPFGYEWRWL